MNKIEFDNGWISLDNNNEIITIAIGAIEQATSGKVIRTVSAILTKDQYNDLIKSVEPVAPKI